jgi:hypothetical protein
LAVSAAGEDLVHLSAAFCRQMMTQIFYADSN